MKQCELCGGDGHVPLGETFVTHDMALDAGIPELEGESFGVQWGQCPECGGYGVVPETQDEADLLTGGKDGASPASEG